MKKLRVMLVVLALGGCASKGVASEPGSTAKPCLEDEPCWDCAVMGNRICGPDGSEGGEW